MYTPARSCKSSGSHSTAQEASYMYTPARSYKSSGSYSTAHVLCSDAVTLHDSCFIVRCYLATPPSQRCMLCITLADRGGAGVGNEISDFVLFDKGQP